MSVPSVVIAVVSRLRFGDEVPKISFCVMRSFFFLFMLYRTGS